MLVMFVGNYLSVAGWGRQGSSVDSIATVLKKITVPRVANEACRRDHLGIAVNEFCVGKSTGNYRNVCHGDSGSPVVVSKHGEYKQVLITFSVCH